jgi:hypothetical protein
MTTPTVTPPDEIDECLQRRRRVVAPQATSVSIWWAFAAVNRPIDDDGACRTNPGLIPRAGSSLLGEQAAARALRDGRGPGGDAQLVQDVREMTVDGMVADEQRVGNRLVRQPFGDKP